MSAPLRVQSSLRPGPSQGEAVIAGLLSGALLFAFLGLIVWLVNRGTNEPKEPRPPVLTWQ